MGRRTEGQEGSGERQRQTGVVGWWGLGGRLSSSEGPSLGHGALVGLLAPGRLAQAHASPPVSLLAVQFGSWFDHIKGWIRMKGKENFLFITYEENASGDPFPRLSPAASPPSSHSPALLPTELRRKASREQSIPNAHGCGFQKGGQGEP